MSGFNPIFDHIIGNYRYGFDENGAMLTGYPVAFQGSMVRNCFVTKDQNTYYMDRYGDKVTSYALQVGYVRVTETNGVRSYDFSGERTNAANEYRAYLIFDAKGAANDSTVEGRTVAAGARKYISTGMEYGKKGGTGSAVIFYYK